MAVNDFLEHNEKIRLLGALRTMTQRGQLTWTDPSGSDPNYERHDVFFTTIAPNFEFLLSSIDRDGVAPYRLDIARRNSERTGGREALARIEMMALDEEGDEEVNRLLEILYSEVNRRMNRPDEAINDLFEAIDRIEPEPPF